MRLVVFSLISFVCSCTAFGALIAYAVSGSGVAAGVAFIALCVAVLAYLARGQERW